MNQNVEKKNRSLLSSLVWRFNYFNVCWSLYCYDSFVDILRFREVIIMILGLMPSLDHVPHGESLTLMNPLKVNFIYSVNQITWRIAKRSLLTKRIIEVAEASCYSRWLRVAIVSKSYILPPPLCHYWKTVRCWNKFRRPSIDLKRLFINIGLA